MSRLLLIVIVASLIASTLLSVAGKPTPGALFLIAAGIWWHAR
jgi:hypothetical protein